MDCIFNNFHTKKENNFCLLCEDVHYIRNVYTCTSVELLNDIFTANFIVIKA